MLEDIYHKKNKNKKRIKKNSSKLVENIIPSIMRGNSNDHENIWYDSRLINEFEDIHQQKKKKTLLFIEYFVIIFSLEHVW